MARESCPNCATKLIEPVSFCPTCDRPTRHASDAEILDWDLKQWRAHVDKSLAGGVVPSAAELRGFGSVLVVSPDRPPAPVARPQMIQPRTAPLAERTVDAPAAKSRLPRKKREQPRVVLDLDADNSFAYRACSTCQATDWIVRTKRNEDETWNYWCIRCSRSFKTENKLRHGVKPFLSSGIVVGGLTAASILILR